MRMSVTSFIDGYTLMDIESMAIKMKQEKVKQSLFYRDGLC